MDKYDLKSEGTYGKLPLNGYLFIQLVWKALTIFELYKSSFLDMVSHEPLSVILYKQREEKKQEARDNDSFIQKS